MRTGTGVRTVGGQIYCDEPGCPADGRAIDPDTHVHGGTPGLSAAQVELTRREIERVAPVVHPQEGLPADFVTWLLMVTATGQAYFAPVGTPVPSPLWHPLGPANLLPPAITRRVQNRVQRDPTEPRMTQVRDVTGGT